KIMTAKRELKEVYYTTRNEDSKADAKELVVASITLQKTVEELISLRQKTKVARKLMEDRKATLTLRKWSTGLPKRISDFKKKKKDMKHEHLHRFQESLITYFDGIVNELNSWITDIETLADLPKPPK
ncbi:MAG: hypothetical protein ACTSU3_09645, partial [Candidatus Thorarchaeota archaeon]